jgi:RbsD / FucU transport protein family
MKLASLALAPLLSILFQPVRAEDWRKTLERELPLLGHRNWIVITDSAYPLQTSPGIETVSTGADLPDVLEGVFQILGTANHVRPEVFVDAELSRVPESDAPGVTAYRQQLASILGNVKPTPVPHEELIGRLDEAGKSFHILLLKTKLCVPYTSVFLRLDCAYWGPDAEKRLREPKP